MHKLRHRPDFVIDTQRFRHFSERRSWPRYPSNSVGCWMGWWEAGISRIVPGLVRDISQAGAAIVSEIPPPEGQVVWICPKSTPSIGWTEGTTVRIEGPGRLRALLGWPYDIGLCFHKCCAWEALQAALYGIGDPSNATAGPPALPSPGDPQS